MSAVPAYHWAFRLLVLLLSTAPQNKGYELDQPPHPNRPHPLPRGGGRGKGEGAGMAPSDLFQCGDVLSSRPPFADMITIIASTSLFCARMQMALTLGFHIVLACLGVGLPVLMLVAEWRFHRTCEPVWRLVA